MGNCPNPHCDGHISVSMDYDWDFSIWCDTCPFWTYLSNNGRLGKKAQELIGALGPALQDLADSIDFAEDYSRDWDEWEKREFNNMAVGLGRREPPNRKYWESRGVVFERTEHGS